VSFLDRTKDVASTVGSSARKQAKRAQLEVDARRIRSRMNKEYAAVGRALHSSLAEGGPGADLPEVQVALAELKMLQEQLDAKSRERASLDEEPAALPAPSSDGTS
jgi:hypothetical protein